MVEPVRRRFQHKHLRTRGYVCAKISQEAEREGMAGSCPFWCRVTAPEHVANAQAEIDLPLRRQRDRRIVLHARQLGGRTRAGQSFTRRPALVLASLEPHPARPPPRERRPPP